MLPHSNYGDVVAAPTPSPLPTIGDSTSDNPKRPLLAALSDFHSHPCQECVRFLTEASPKSVRWPCYHRLTMTVILSHRSALICLDQLARSDGPFSMPLALPPASGDLIKTAYVPSKRILRDLCESLHVPPPYDLLVPKASSRRYADGTVAHLCSRELPDGALLRIRDGLFVCAPPLVLLQLARKKSPIETLKLANYMLAGYSFSRTSADGIVDRRPLLSHAELLGLADSFPSFHGTKQLRDVARWAIPDSASPMESALAAVLTLPVQRGGFGLSRPSLNHPIGLSPRARQLYNVRTCRIDLYWPQVEFGLEFDSRAHHSEAEHHGSDIARTLALARMGISIEPVTALQMRDAEQLIEIARIVAKETGSRAKVAAPGQRAAHAELMHELLA